jgi:hypothetical protein
LAGYLVSLLIPTTTDTILQRSECAVVDPGGSCFQVFFDPQDPFAWVILGGVALVVLAQLPTRILTPRHDHLD